jgi:hypothetical protein
MFDLFDRVTGSVTLFAFLLGVIAIVAEVAVMHIVENTRTLGTAFGLRNSSCTFDTCWVGTCIRFVCDQTAVVALAAERFLSKEL